MKVSALTYGGIITELLVPDRQNVMSDVTPGFNTIADYETDTAFFGALVGRYCNRISGAKFTLDEQEYTLARNDGVNSLHGGDEGFHKKIWHAEPFERADSVGIVFNYLSPDGAGGFPGNLAVKVIYTLNNDNELTFEYTATTDQTTVCNLTQHTYFNLAGHDAGSTSDHELTIFADFFLPVGADLIPRGELRPVDTSPFDFRKSKLVSADVEDDDQQLKNCGGYDHNWVLSKDEGVWGKAAELYEPRFGRVMQVWTTEPGIQFYGGNFIESTIMGKGGRAYGPRCALAIETQHYPDSPNQEQFPNTSLYPGEVYQTKTVYRFSTR